MIILSYSRAKLWLHGAIGAGFGSILLYFTLPPLLQQVGELRYLQLILPGVGIGLLAYGLALAVRASGELPALRADGGALAITTLFGTTSIPWRDFGGASLIHHPKSREPQLILAYRGAEGLAEQTLHLMLTEEPACGYEGLADRISQAQGIALNRVADRPPPHAVGAAHPAAPSFGRKQA